MSNNPLYATFSIENEETAEITTPTDFLLSTDVATSNKILAEHAKNNNLDISKGYWVYSFDEDKIFKAKEGNILQVYENDKVMGTFEYSSTKILWIDYDEKYTANWRGTDLILKKVLQGFVFP